MKKDADGIFENVIVALLGFVMLTAFMVIIFGAFSSISDKWAMRQVARSYLLLMETQGYLSSDDQADLLEDLEALGLYDISLAGTTTSEVGYGNRIYLKIEGTYDDNVLSFASGLSKVASHPTTVSISRQSTAKQ